MSSWQPPHTHTTHVTRPVDTRIQYMLLANTCKKHWTEAWNKSGIKTKFEVGTPGSLLQLCLQRTYLQPSNQGLFVLWPVPSGGALRPCCREQHKPRWLQLDYMTVLLPRNTEPGYCSVSSLLDFDLLWPCALCSFSLCPFLSLSVSHTLCFLQLAQAWLDFCPCGFKREKAQVSFTQWLIHFFSPFG